MFDDRATSAGSQLMLGQELRGLVTARRQSKLISMGRPPVQHAVAIRKTSKSDQQRRESAAPPPHDLFVGVGFWKLAAAVLGSGIAVTYSLVNLVTIYVRAQGGGLWSPQT